jgi:adenylate cyclase
MVLPLEVLADDPEQVYFADGLAEQLVVALTGYPGYVIIGPLSRKRLEAMPAIPVEELGRRYAAQFVLQGKLRKGGDRVRTSLRLVNIETRGAAWARTFDGRLSATDLFGFEDAVATEVAATLADNFGVITRELTRRPRAQRTDSLEAYDAVLRYHHYFTVLTEDAWRNAFDALETAVASDPNYALTHAMLADMYGARYHLIGASEDALMQMERLVTRAVQLDSGNQLAHQMRAMAHFFRGRRELFLVEADWALRINPNIANALASCGLFLAIVGEWERGLALLRKAMKLSPHYPGWYHLAVFLDLYRSKAYEDAWQEALSINTPGLYLDPLARAAVLGQLGRTQEAARALDALKQLLPQSEVGIRAFLRRTLFSDANVDILFDGLRKAGLEIED